MFIDYFNIEDKEFAIPTKQKNSTPYIYSFESRILTYTFSLWNDITPFCIENSQMPTSPLLIYAHGISVSNENIRTFMEIYNDNRLNHKLKPITKDEAIRLICSSNFQKKKNLGIIYNDA